MTPRLMKVAPISACIVAVLGASLMPKARAEEPSTALAGLVGWLDIAPQAETGGEGLRLAMTGRAFALREVKGRYTLDIRREGSGGTSTSRQGGAFLLSAGRPGQLSQVTLNLSPADRLEIELKLFVGEAEIFSVTVQSGPRRI